MPKWKILTSRNVRFCISTFLSRIFLGGIVVICLCLAFAGCASLSRVATTGTKGSAAWETPKSLAFYHFLKAQQLLVAEDSAGAIQEYEAALANDPESAFLEMELAALYQRQGDVKQALLTPRNPSGWTPSNRRPIFSWPACTWASTSWKRPPGNTNASSP